MNVSLPPRIVKDRKRRDMRLRCPAHLAFVRSHACSIAGCSTGTPIEAAHVRLDTKGGMGLKPDDCWTLSLCAVHHQQQHMLGEMQFAAWYKIDMKALAQVFWEAFKRHNPGAARRAEMRTLR